MTWIKENWETLAAGIAAAHALALVIVNLTPTPKDDEVLSKVYSVIAMVAGLFTKEAQEGSQPE